MGKSPSDPASTESLAAMAFAESLANSYAAKGGDVADLFTAYVGIVAECDLGVSGQSLEATDRYVSMMPPPFDGGKGGAPTA